LPPGAGYKIGRRAPRLVPAAMRLLRRLRAARPPCEASLPVVEQVGRTVDVLVVGGGIAGLAAAEAATAAGLRVLVAECQTRLGGIADNYDGTIAGAAPAVWLADRVAGLAAAGTAILTGATVTVLGAEGSALIDEAGDATHGPRLWHVTARAVVLATGAAEMPLAFPGNDGPGVLLAGAARLALRRRGTLPGRRVVIAAASDEGYRTALDLAAAGAAVERVVDLRLESEGPMAYIARAHGIRMVLGSGPVAVGRGRGGLATVVVANRVMVDDVALTQTIPCDTLLVSGGWSPDLRLAAQAGARLAFDTAYGLFRIERGLDWLFAAGAANAHYNLAEALDDGWRAGTAAAALLGRPTSEPPARDISATADAPPEMAVAVTSLAGPEAQADTILDAENGVSLRDLAIAMREGYRAPAQLARYAGLGRGGADAAAAALAAIAVTDLGGAPAAPDGWSTEAVAPVPLAALAGPTGAAAFALRTTALGPLPAGVPATAVGGWRLALAFPRPGEAAEPAIRREVAAARATAGLADLSARGRFAVSGAEARAFLDHLLATDLSGLAPGGVMLVLALDEQGFVQGMADLAQFDEERFLLSAAPAATAAWRALLRRAAVAWRGAAPAVADETGRWGAVWVGGPAAADLVHDIADDAGRRPASGRLWQGHVAGTEAWAVPHAATGDPAVEIAVAAAALPALWQRLEPRVVAAGGAVIGSGAWARLHLEAGAPDPVRDGTGITTAADLGLGALVAAAKGGFVGRAALGRRAMAVAGRAQLAGLLPEGKSLPAPGTLLVAGSDGAAARTTVGHVTRSGHSPTARRPIALGLVADAPARIGEQVFFRLSGELCPALVTAPQRIALGPAAASSNPRPADPPGEVRASGKRDPDEAVVD
jgi:sarcosine oxidase subunit alpha